MTSIELLWKNYLNEIYQNGYNFRKDDSEIRGILGYHTLILAPHRNGINYPYIDAQTALNNFLNDIKDGRFNIDGYPLKNESLYNYVTAWDKQDMIDCTDFVYTYPERIFNYEHINQYDIIKKRLTNNLGSNRGVAVLYNPEIDQDRVDIPCLNWIQALMKEKHLYLSCMFRSNDIYGAWPSNMMLLTYLGLKLANDLNVNFGGIDYHCSSAHYYKTDEDAIKRVLGYG